MDDELFGRAMHAFGDAVNLVEPLRVRFWQDRGLTIAQVSLLFLLYRHDGQSIGELAAGLYSRPATVTGLASRLERAGYVKRRGDIVDRRVVGVSLTPKGRRAVAEVRVESRAHLKQVFELMGDARVSKLADLLHALVQSAAIVASNADEHGRSAATSVHTVPEGRA